MKEKIQGLFDDAKKKWEGVFAEESKILLSPSHLAVCVSTLQDIKLFNNNLDVVDDAFEYLMSKAQKGEKGQYFTPRYVIDMCVKMMNPTINDKIIDTACGSSGFTVHSIFKVWKEIRLSKGLEPGEDFTASERTNDEEHYEHTTYASRQLTKIQSLEKRALSIIWSIFTLNAKDDSNKTYDEMIRSRNSYEVIRQNPLNYFEYHMEVDLQPNRVLTASEESWYKKLYETRNQNSVIWFLSFVYRLRNALFHEIIDPLNEEWQLIFKNAYLVLKEIVDLNISEIGKTAIAENSVV